ncbi:uncharacterized protein A1O9_05550 [Exophiala aquamarina CBS 119918]|uniref:DUF1479 domain protein n=1 Tax=Exophiala aquamarina CBS 119918 TaxID=1182545 RepID=A0A072PCX8_9EURO|nr:uncharacterized protein A1O9_05550 [Exophiala aquamarina CBS 119918]KEF57632.1 hypothetical protein A1O9_05550 [Exophiala aquamarina CBS 119918]
MGPGWAKPSAGQWQGEGNVLHRLPVSISHDPGSPQSQEFRASEPPLLDQRFAVLKASLVKKVHKQKVIESYGRLVDVLNSEVNRIEKSGSSMVPEIDFNHVRNNGCTLPPDFANLVRDRGCVILRNVVPEEQAVVWEAKLKDYVHRHPGVGGVPPNKPAGWNIYWTEPQVQIRSHPAVLEAMNIVSRLWNVSDPSLLIDLDSQVVYPDRIRIRQPSDDPDQFPLPPHLDSGGTERWEDDAYRQNYEAIFEGRWQEWDGWAADQRLNARSDLYANKTSCSAWRSLQGWISLSHTNTGEGTLRLLPSLKASVAYMLLKPLFVNDEFDDSQPTFPGATPGSTQFFPTPEHHPHLAIDRALIGIPPVRPGDYVFWHCDLVHGVDTTNPGKNDSTVFYNACTPLTPYNLDSLLGSRAAFEKGVPPRDFERLQGGYEVENMHDDCGAQKENILSDDGLRAMGFMSLDETAERLTDGQREMRRMANVSLGL